MREGYDDAGEPELDGTDHILDWVTPQALEKIAARAMQDNRDAYKRISSGACAFCGTPGAKRYPRWEQIMCLACHDYFEGERAKWNEKWGANE